jgi:hypothetical protein
MIKLTYKNNKYKKLGDREWVIYSEGKYGGSAFNVMNEDVIDLLECEYERLIGVEDKY